MQVQTPEVSDAKASTPALKVGDKVSYVIARCTGRSVRLTAREGTVVGLDGNMAVVKSRNGRTIIQPVSKLTPAGEPNALTRALLGGAQ